MQWWQSRWWPSQVEHRAAGGRPSVPRWQPSHQLAVTNPHLTHGRVPALTAEALISGSFIWWMLNASLASRHMMRSPQVREPGSFPGWDFLNSTAFSRAFCKSVLRSAEAITSERLSETKNFHLSLTTAAQVWQLKSTNGWYHKSCLNMFLCTIWCSHNNGPCTSAGTNISRVPEQKLTQSSKFHQLSQTLFPKNPSIDDSVAKNTWSNWFVCWPKAPPIAAWQRTHLIFQLSTCWVQPGFTIQLPHESWRCKRLAKTGKSITNKMKRQISDLFNDQKVPQKICFDRHQRTIFASHLWAPIHCSLPWRSLPLNHSYGWWLTNNRLRCHT